MVVKPLYIRDDRGRESSKKGLGDAVEGWYGFWDAVWDADHAKEDGKGGENELVNEEVEEGFGWISSGSDPRGRPARPKSKLRHLVYTATPCG